MSRRHFGRAPGPIFAPRPKGHKRHASNQVSQKADAAADRMEALGASPRVQLTAAKLASGQSNLTYKPHQGRQERVRRAIAAGMAIDEALALNPAQPSLESLQEQK